MLESIINYGLDTSLLPLKSKLNVSNDPLWISPSLKKLIQRRQAALASGDEILFKSLRNQVDRKRKSCRGKFYSSKVEYLKTCLRAEWWKEAKKLSGISLQVPRTPNNNPTDMEDLILCFQKPVMIFKKYNKTMFLYFFKI
jgi:hypothetical protein